MLTTQFGKAPEKLIGSVHRQQLLTWTVDDESPRMSRPLLAGASRGRMCNAQRGLIAPLASLMRLTVCSLEELTRTYERPKSALTESTARVSIVGQ